MAIEKTIRKFSSHEELRRTQLQEWQKLSPEVITEHAWKLVVEYRKMHGLEPYKPRLEKRITSVRHSNREALKQQANEVRIPR